MQRRTRRNERATTNTKTAAALAVAAAVMLGALASNRAAAQADDSAAADGKADPVARIVAAHGFDRWDRVEAIRFTFTVIRGESVSKRGWHWRPGENRVRMTVDDPEAPDGKRIVAYDRDELEGAAKRVIDADRKFINDSFWLLMPLHLSWAENVEVKDTGPHALPIGEGEARRIVVQYPRQGGYTPGDRYDLYVDKDWRIVQWTFHRGGGEKPNLATTWEAYAKAGPLVLSLNRRNPGSGFAITFPNTAVKLEGEAGWQPADQVDVDEAPSNDGDGE